MREFKKHDFLNICDWMIKRGSVAPEYDLLPPTGLIQDNIACGFLIKTDNNFGILDFFITNPDMPIMARGSAVDEITACLIEKAKRDGIKVLKCDTTINSIYKMAIKHGFEPVGEYTALVRGI